MWTYLPPFPKVRVMVRRYEVILMGSVFLLSGAVMPAHWVAPPAIMPRPIAPKMIAPVSVPLLRSMPVVKPAILRPTIALTFDDGPHPGMTDRLLKLLEKEKVPATFFVVGKMAERYPDLLQNIHRAGHEIANHSYNHYNMKQLSDDDVRRELDQTQTVVQRITGQPCNYFRPPGGEYSRRVVRIASLAGYRMVLWSILTADVEGSTPKSMRRRILRGAQDGGIVLMHSGIESTLEMLPGAIAALREKGYDFVTVSALLHRQDLSRRQKIKSVPVAQAASPSTTAPSS